MAIKVAVNGAGGRMGQAVIDAIALSDAVELVGAYDYKTISASDVGPVDIKQVDEMDPQVFDVMIDFSTPDGALVALERCAEAGKAAVVGTTGFDNAQRAMFKALADSIPVVIAPNMSLGMNMCFQLIRRASEVLGDEADIEIIEAHHRYKVDAPSGTALRMGEVIADTLGIDLARCAIYGRQGKTGVRSDKTIGFHSIRGGDIFGEHTASFSFAGEEIEIKHKASSRLAFSRGAVSAAVWIVGRKPGCYGMDNVLGF